MRRIGIELHLTVTYNPAANGKIERGHQTLIGALIKVANFDECTWVDLFPLTLWADQMKVHRTTGYTPITLMHGIRATLPVDEAVSSWRALPWADGLFTGDLIAARIRQVERCEEEEQLAGQRLKEQKEEEKRHIDSRRRTHPRMLAEGDWVLIRNERIDTEYMTQRKFTHCWFGPYVLMEAEGTTGTYQLRKLDGALLKKCYSGNQLKVFVRHSSGAGPEA